MTSAALKEVGNVSGILPNAATSPSKGTASCFQEVLNSHTGREDAKQAPTQKDRPKENMTPGESLKIRHDNRVQDSRTKEAGSGTEALQEPDSVTETELSEEEMEKAMEVLGGTARQLLDEIAKLFGVSRETLQGMMEQLGMKPIEVLNPAKLSELLLFAAGAGDTVSLVTNGELYENYKAVFQKLEQLLQQAKEQLNLDPKQLAALTDQMAEDEAIPVEVTVEAQAEPEQTGKIEQQSGAEDVPTGNPQAEGKEVSVSEAGERNHPGQSSREGGQTDAKGGQAGNFLFQNLQTENFTQVQQLVKEGAGWDADTQDIMKQILDYMKIQIKPEETTLEMQLHPESLGTVHVQVASKGGVVTAHFVTQNEAVKAALESQMVQLKESFSEQGVKVEAIEVTVQTHEFEQSFDDSRERGQAGDGRKSGRRQLNLNESFDLDSMEPEEILEAEVMSAKGSTVSYTA